MITYLPRSPVGLYKYPFKKDGVTVNVILPQQPTVSSLNAIGALLFTDNFTIGFVQYESGASRVGTITEDQFNELLELAKALGEKKFTNDRLKKDVIKKKRDDIEKLRVAVFGEE